MDRGLIVGALAFAVAFAGERLFAGLAKDIARYEAMRKMSGQPPIAKELLALAGSFVGEHGGAAANGTIGLVGSLTSDIMRYAKMKAM